MIDMGAYAERKAADYLRKKRYKLLDFNFKTRFGEIDLIFKYKKYIVFVEVKARDLNAIAQPKEFVDYSKRERIIKAAMQYISYTKTDLQPRFDIIEIFYEKDTIKSVKHLENAFTLD